MKADPHLHPFRLLAAARSGEEWAWAKIFDAHYPNLYRFFRSRVATHEIADDLSLNVFLEAYQVIRSFRGDFLDAWLFGIARRVLATHAGSEDPLPRIRPEFLAPEIRDTFERLKPDQRTALELRYVVGLSGEEAAAVMDRAPGAFRSLLDRATGAFAQAHDGEWGDDRAASFSDANVWRQGSSASP